MKLSVTIHRQTPSPPLYWVPHDKFRYSYDNPKDRRYNPAGDGKIREWGSPTLAIPEVYNLNASNTKIPPEFQDLVCKINPDLSRDKAMTLMGDDLAFCNNTNFILDPPRVMGGWLVTGKESGGVLWLETIRVDKAVPPAEYVLSKRYLWGWCAGVSHAGNISLFLRKGIDGNMYPCRFPLMTKEEVFIPLDELLRLPPNFIPDPHWMPK